MSNQRGSFYFFLVALSGLVLVYWFLPETKGKTLEEIANDFQRKETVNTAELATEK
ncbi:MAG: sugar porter family MFS transporter [Colwellia sp.]